MEEAPKKTSIKKKSNLGWAGYFLILLGMGIVAVTVMVVYNIRQQLKPDQLEAAHELWKENAPKNYDLKYLIKRPGDQTDKFYVKVRKGETVELTLNGKSQPRHLYRHHGMPALFRYVKRFMEIDQDPKTPKSFTRAIFHKKDGHIMWYVRRVSGTKDRVEVEVKEFKEIE